MIYIRIKTNLTVVLLAFPDIYHTTELIMDYSSPNNHYKMPKKRQFHANLNLYLTDI